MLRFPAAPYSIIKARLFSLKSSPWRRAFEFISNDFSFLKLQYSKEIMTTKAGEQKNNTILVFLVTRLPTRLQKTPSPSRPLGHFRKNKSATPRLSRRAALASATPAPVNLNPRVGETPRQKNVVRIKPYPTEERKQCRIIKSEDDNMEGDGPPHGEKRRFLPHEELTKTA